MKEYELQKITIEKLKNRGVNLDEIGIIKLLDEGKKNGVNTF